MDNVNVFKAIGGNTPNLYLSATEELPELPLNEDWETLHAQRFDEQAQLIVNGFLESLPGGTVDAVLRLLLDHKRSFLAIPYCVIPPIQGETANGER